MVAPGSEEQVRYDIIIEVQAALKSMQEMLRATDSNQEKIILFTETVLQSSKAWGVSWQQALAAYKQLQAELSKSHQAGIFGQTGGQDLMKQSEAFLQAKDSAGLLSKEEEKVGEAATTMATKTQTATKGMLFGVNLVRIALGAIVAMILFNIIQAFQNMATEGLKAIKSLEVSLYNLVNAERAMSQSGIEVTFKDLEAIVDRISKKFAGMFSQKELQDAVADIAISTKELGFSVQQIEQVAQVVATLQLRNPDKTLQQVSGEFLTAILSGRTQAIQRMGIAANEQTVKEKALQMGLIKTGQDLSVSAKAAAILQLAYEATSKETDNLTGRQNTLSAAQQKLSAAWQNLLGQMLKIIAPNLIKFLESLTNGINRFSETLKAAQPLLQQWSANLAGIQKLNAAWANAKSPADKLNVLKHAFDIFASGFKDAADYFNAFDNQLDTATANISNAADTTLQDADKLKQGIEDIMRDSANALADLNEKLGQKKEDINTEYQRKAADAETDYQRKVVDINKDAEREIAALKDKQRQEDLKAQQDYELKLWELRMRYLMDLEDALHARDARQVIRLQKQYEIDKEALARKQNLDDQQRTQDQKNQLADIELKRQQRLADAKLEYDQKLADQRLAKQRELDDLKIWYARELQDLEISKRRKLEALLDSWIQEGKITEANAANVYGILYKYFGPGGLTDQLNAYMLSHLVSPQIAVPSFGGSPATITPSGTNGAEIGGRSMGSITTTSGGSVSKKRAEGGTFVASRPTTMTFGESGMEMAQFTPLTKLGKDTGKVFNMNGGNGSGVNGEIQVELLLSPDLEARVVNASMDGVANIVTKVNRMKR